MRTRGTDAARAATVVQASPVGPPLSAPLGMKWSAIQSPSQPVASACRAPASTSAWGTLTRSQTLNRHVHLRIRAPRV